MKGGQEGGNKADYSLNAIIGLSLEQITLIQVLIHLLQGVAQAQIILLFTKG
jgi:hypothetical protein